jgi:tyrosyl-tRNA synthetase
MSISDDLMWRYYELVTDVSLTEIERMKNEVVKGGNPRDFKARLARLIIGSFYTEKEAERAEEEFNRVFRQREIPSEIAERVIKARDEEVLLVNLLAEFGLTSSNSEGRRLVNQGGVYVDGERVVDANLTVSLSESRELLFRVGKRRFLRLKIS